MKILGISGVAKSGKDTLADLLLDCAKENGINAIKISLAEPLKNDINEFLIKKLNIDIWNCTPEEKEFVRPLLVAYGKAQRIKTSGKYWTGLLSHRIENEIDKNVDLVIIPDVRYDEYEEDEAGWIIDNGIEFIHLTRVAEDGSIVPPPNKDEEENDPRMQEAATKNIQWSTDIEEAKDTARFLWNSLNL